MKKGHLLPLFLAVAVLVVLSCTKHGPEGPSGETGAQGPIGPKGDRGDTGTNGNDGTNGTDGTNGSDGAQGPAGTANVIYSNWFTNDEFSLSWTDSTITSTITADPEVISKATKFAPDVTSQMLDSGIVLSYIRNKDVLISPQLLPWLFSYTDENTGNLMYCQLNIYPQDGVIVYYVSNLTSHDATGISPNPAFEYRYIIIPGGVLAGGRKINLKAMSYNEICKAYNIPQ